MNKRAARAKALEGKLSIGDLRTMIKSKRGKEGTSKVNKLFTLPQVLDIYERAIAERPEGEIPVVMRRDPYSRSGRMKPTRDVLLITNILRDCG